MNFSAFYFPYRLNVLKSTILKITWKVITVELGNKLQTTLTSTGSRFQTEDIFWVTLLNHWSKWVYPEKSLQNKKLHDIFQPSIHLRLPMQNILAENCSKRFFETKLEEIKRRVYTMCALYLSLNEVDFMHSNWERRAQFGRSEPVLPNWHWEK